MTDQIARVSHYHSRSTMSIRARRTGQSLLPIRYKVFAHESQNLSCPHGTDAMLECGVIMHTSQQSGFSWLAAPAPLPGVVVGDVVDAAPDEATVCAESSFTSSLHSTRQGKSSESVQCAITDPCLRMHASQAFSIAHCIDPEDFPASVWASAHNLVHSSRMWLRLWKWKTWKHFCTAKSSWRQTTCTARCPQPRTVRVMTQTVRIQSSSRWSVIFYPC